MRCNLRALCAAAVALGAAGVAQAQTSDPNAFTSPYLADTNFDPVGPYIGAAGGGSFLNNVSPHGAGTDVKSQFDGSYVGLGTIGWNFGDGLRAEVEGGYRRGDIDGVRDAGPGERSGALGMYTVMVNGLYDFDPGRFGVQSYGLVPHLGLGVGWADPRFDHAGPFNGNQLSGHDNLFAYQGIAGVDYKVAPQIKFSLDYKYLATENGEFTVSPGAGGASRASTSIQDQAVLLGVKYEFGEPPPAPQPVAPPPPVRPAPPPPAPVPEAQRAFQVFFDFNKSDLTGAARQVIKAAADAAQSGHFVHLVVTGHTDTVGSARYNQGLSERRADSVKNELVADGVPDAEITTLGVGKTGLLVPTADGVREAQNRRATIELGSNASS
jgi:outer membrane protein OmpA-like peptidoglycan-associated protein